MKNLSPAQRKVVVRVDCACRGPGLSGCRRNDLAGAATSTKAHAGGAAWFLRLGQRLDRRFASLPNQLERFPSFAPPTPSTPQGRAELVQPEATRGCSSVTICVTAKPPVRRDSRSRPSEIALGASQELKLSPVREWCCRGEVAEWSIAAVSKTVEPSRVPGVRISPSPPFLFSAVTEFALELKTSAAARSLARRAH